MKQLVEKVKMNQTWVQWIIFLNRFITFFVYATYPSLIIYLWMNKDIRLKPFVLLPLVSFILLSIVRKLKDAPRPYEIHDFEPILNKDSKGESFPSRHVFSIFVISGAVYSIFPVFGVLLGLMGIILAICRVLGGVHFSKDVIAGAIVGILVWVIYLW